MAKVRQNWWPHPTTTTSVLAAPASPPPPPLSSSPSISAPSGTAGAPVTIIRRSSTEMQLPEAKDGSYGIKAPSRPSFQLESKTELKKQLLERLNVRQSVNRVEDDKIIGGAADSYDSNNKESHRRRREVHIFSERRRRRGMTHLYATLQSLLPVPMNPKADRCTVVAEAMDYIEKLRGEVERLKEVRREMMQKQVERMEAEGGGGRRKRRRSRSGAEVAEMEEEEEEDEEEDEVSVKMYGRDAFVSVKKAKCKAAERRKGVWPAILHLLTAHLRLHLLNVTFSSAGHRHHYHSIHARIPTSCDWPHNSSDVEKMLRAVIV